MAEQGLLHAADVGWRLSPHEGGGRILEACTLSVGEGKWISLVGPNGAGKSTLLQLLSGTLGFSRSQFGGSIRWRGRDWTAMRPRECAAKVAYVAADLDPAFPMTVDEVVGSGVYASGSCNAIEPALDFCDLLSLRSRPIEFLSGGERQRVALARALVQGAEVLFLDEALSKMDLDYQVDLGSRLKSLLRNPPASPFHISAVVLVAHDLGLSLRWSDEAWVLAAGKVVSSGPVAEALSEEVLRRIYPKAAPSILFQK